MKTIKIFQDKIKGHITLGKLVLIFGTRRIGKNVMVRKIVDAFLGQTIILYDEDYDMLVWLKKCAVANCQHLLMGINQFEKQIDYLTALEVQWRNKRFSELKVFQKEFLRVEFHVVNRENYFVFV